MADVNSVIQLLTEQLCECVKRNEALENELRRLQMVVCEEDAEAIQEVLDL